MTSEIVSIVADSVGVAEEEDTTADEEGTDPVAALKLPLEEPPEIENWML